MRLPYPRQLLFMLPAEAAHALTLVALRATGWLPARAQAVTQPVRLAGLEFPNRIGLAAGFDKNAVAVNGLGRLGFGFIEVGTITPRPQHGNRQRPRVVRLSSRGALINRLGFPSDGAAVVAARLRRLQFPGIVGVNIGKNTATPNERAVHDYLICFDALYDHADYIAINVSSPNTPHLRELQRIDQLKAILEPLLEARSRIWKANPRPLPIFVKISPDLGPTDLAGVAEVVRALGLEGIIATNTTLSHPDCDPFSGNASGGLSGRPLLQLALTAVRSLRAALPRQAVIIGCGGVQSADDALQMRRAGADLIQVYSGLIFRGPKLIRELSKAL
jgi:dihydroorotate dehydrogenase